MQDPLLNSPYTLAAAEQRIHWLWSSLPLSSGKFPVSIPRSAERAGLVAKENRSINEISRCLPVVLLLKGGDACYSIRLT